MVIPTPAKITPSNTRVLKNVTILPKMDRIPLTSSIKPGALCSNRVNGEICLYLIKRPTTINTTPAISVIFCRPDIMPPPMIDFCPRFY